MLWVYIGLVRWGQMSFQLYDGINCACCGMHHPKKHFEFCKIMILCKICYDDAYSPSHRKDDEPVDRIFVTKIATLLVGGILKERIPDRNEEGNYVYDNDGMLKQSERSLIDRSSGDSVKDEWAQLE